MRRLVLAVLALLVLAPAAHAGDAAVFAAYDDQDAVDAAAEAYLEASRRLDEGGGGKAVLALIRADQRINRALVEIATALEATGASSADGRAARRFALAEVDGWSTANHLEIRSVRAVADGDRPRAGQLAARANRIMRDRTLPSGTRAVRRFRAAGFDSGKRSLTRASRPTPGEPAAS